MRPSTYMLAGSCPRTCESPGERAARLTAGKTRKAATLLEQVFRLMAEDDCIQPAIKYVYAALCETETRAAVVEDWYGRTYSDNSLLGQPCQPAG